MQLQQSTNSQAPWNADVSASDRGSDHDKTVEQLRAQLSAAGIQPASSGQRNDKDQLQRQAQLLSELLEEANKKLLQAESTANDLRAAMRTKLAVSDERQIQIESRVAELQQQLELHSIPAEAERTALSNMCEGLQAENKELKQKVGTLQQQLSKAQAGAQSAQAV